MSRDDVEILDRAVAYDGFFRIDRYRLRHRLFGGGMSDVLVREVFERGHAIGVLPFDPERNQVVLIEQFRIGALAAGEPPWLLECVAGIIEEGETPEEVARRELREETGLEATELRFMQRYLSSPGGASETVQAFLARVDARQAGGVHGHGDEDIRVGTYDLIDALALLHDGRIDNSVTVIALQWLALHQEDVMAQWADR